MGNIAINKIKKNNYEADIHDARIAETATNGQILTYNNGETEWKDQLSAGTGIAINNGVISATGEAISFDNKTIVKGTDNKYQTAIGGWKENTPEQTTALFVDTKGDGSHTYIGPGSSDKYEVGWDYNTTITSLVSSATEAIINIKFTVLGSTFNNKVTLYKQQTIPYKWQSNNIIVGDKEYTITVHDQYVGTNNGGIVVAAVDESTDLSAAIMELCSLVTGAASIVYHPIDNNFLKLDNDSIVLGTDSKLTVNATKVQQKLTAGTGIAIDDNNVISATITTGSNSFVINAKSNITGTEDSNNNFTNVTAITGVTLSNLKIGDNIYIKALDVPDYWVSQISPSISLNKLETTKINLSNYYTKTEIEAKLSNSVANAISSTLGGSY